MTIRTTTAGHQRKTTANRDIRHQPRPPTNNAMYHPSRYKIELCYQFEETGHCQFGDRCLYAHGQFELRPCTYRHSKFKTQLCRAFHEEGFCSFGSRCCFIHTKPDLDLMMKGFELKPIEAMAADDKTSDFQGGNNLFEQQPDVDRLLNDICLWLLVANMKTKMNEVAEYQLLPSPFDDEPNQSHRLPAFIKLCS